MFFEENCIACESCIAACPYGEVLRENWPLAKDVCSGCGACIGECYAKARNLVGRWMTRDEVLEIIRRDRVFYEESHGGVTVGGGEPTLQAGFVAGLLEACREEGIHTAIETCGFTSWKTMKSVLIHVDQLLMDVKHMDTRKHEQWTGVPNERILENARKASLIAPEMVVRLPLIPTFNDDDENLHALARFIRDELNGVRRIDVLPYHSTGESKSARLYQPYSLPDLVPQTRERLAEVRSLLSQYELNVRIG